jgi:predicted Zn-dependent protease
MTKQFSKAIKTFQQGKNLDDTRIATQLNLAHAYLLEGDYKSAKLIYKEYQNQNVTDSISWKQNQKTILTPSKNQAFLQKILIVFKVG